MRTRDSSASLTQSDHDVLCCRLEPHSSSEPTDLAIATGVQLPLKASGLRADTVTSTPLSPSTGMIPSQSQNPGIRVQELECRKSVCMMLAEVVSSVACVKAILDSCMLDGGWCLSHGGWQSGAVVMVDSGCILMEMI